MSAEISENKPQIQAAPPGSCYLSAVHIQGFRTIRSLQAAFLPGLNVIIGENGVGKTNLLICLEDALHFSGYKPESSPKFFEVSLLIAGYLRRITGEAQSDSGSGFSLKPKYIYDGIKDMDWLSLAKRGPMIPGRQILLIQYKFPDEILFFKPSTISFDYKNIIPFSKPSNELNGFIFKEYVFIHDLMFFINENNFKNLNEDAIANIKKIINNKIDGDINFIIDSVIKFSNITNIRLNPGFQIYIDGNQGIIQVDNLILNFQVDGQWLPFDMLSDGTKRIIYIIAKIASAPANSIILLEEPELGIHPQQLYRLMQFIQEQSSEKQIILTTHSPEVLNFIAPDALDRIQVAYFKKGAGTQLRRLTTDEQAHARRYIYTEGLSLSDFWVHSGSFSENPDHIEA